MVSLLNCSHSSRGVVMYRCGFNLYFLMANDVEHRVICHPYVFIRGEGSLCPRKDMYKTVPRSFIHTGPQVETNLMCIHENNWQTAIQSYSEVPLGKEEQTIPQPRRGSAGVLRGVEEARHKSLSCVVRGCSCQKFKNS